jgi:ppGpp synthetase/RelA/SpoT-type nucleotidyltranferase
MNAPYLPRWFDAMDYAKPRHPIPEVNAAGKRVATLEGTASQLAQAIDIVDNWRASHSYPLNSFHTTLKGKARKVAGNALTAQRIKRLESICFKLSNEPTMKLSQMQDIGGCRAVVPSIADVYELVYSYDANPVAHTRGNDKDYIQEPKSSGYRGVHLKYRFLGRKSSKDWSDLKIEIQIRTLLQHKWATAVEAAGTFTKQALKSNRGSTEWLRFFALMSSIFALKEEQPTIPGTPTTYPELCEEVRELNRQYHIQSTFAQYSAIITHIEKERGAKYFLLKLDPVNYVVTVTSFRSNESQLANRAYTHEETKVPQGSGIQVVLVSVSSISALRRAYPNYFLDTQDFLRELAGVTGVAIP